MLDLATRMGVRLAAGLGAAAGVVAGSFGRGDETCAAGATFRYSLLGLLLLSLTNVVNRMPRFYFAHKTAQPFTNQLVSHVAQSSAAAAVRTDAKTPSADGPRLTVLG